MLLVEDDIEMAQMLSEYLAQSHMLVDQAHDGALAAEVLRARRYDLVLLDVGLPGRDGFELLRQLRTTSATPVIMLSARGSEGDRVLGLELGADDYLAKPFGPRELLARMRAVLRGRDLGARASTPAAAPPSGERSGVLQMGELRHVCTACRPRWRAARWC